MIFAKWWAWARHWKKNTRLWKNTFSMKKNFSEKIPLPINGTAPTMPLSWLTTSTHSGRSDKHWRARFDPIALYTIFFHFFLVYFCLTTVVFQAHSAPWSIGTFCLRGFFKPKGKTTVFSLWESLFLNMLRQVSGPTRPETCRVYFLTSRSLRSVFFGVARGIRTLNDRTTTCSVTITP